MAGEQKQTEEVKKISRHDFYFETPLYELLKYGDINEVEDLFTNDIDAYSAVNSMDTTYEVKFSWIIKIDEKYVSSYTSYFKGFGMITLTCKRKGDDILRFFVFKDEIGKQLMKVGQYPSLAFIQFAEIGKKYDKVLPEQDLKNLKKAIGLVAHGAGAGSFVYLRRIFENLIFEAYTVNSSAISVTEADFKKQRMMDKVDTLKDYLPSQLVEMKSVYSVLSKGVHELTEEECLRYFGPIKLSIELILDQKIEEAKKKERDVLVKKQLQQIHQEISGTDSGEKNTEV